MKLWKGKFSFRAQTFSESISPILSHIKGLASLQSLAGSSHQSVPNSSQVKMQMKFALIPMVMATVNADLQLPPDTQLDPNYAYVCDVPLNVDSSGLIMLNAPDILKFANDYGVRNHNPEKRYGSYHTETGNTAINTWQNHVRLEFELTQPKDKKNGHLSVGVTKFTGNLWVRRYPSLIY